MSRMVYVGCAEAWLTGGSDPRPVLKMGQRVDPVAEKGDLMAVAEAPGLWFPSACFMKAGDPGLAFMADVMPVDEEDKSERPNLAEADMQF